MGDKWETSAKSCGPEHSEHPDAGTSVVGDRWETSPQHSEHPGCTERKMKDK